MDLNALLSRYPGFQLATEADNFDILRFFDQTAMNAAKLNLRYERKPDFFRFLKFQSDRSLVFIARDERNELGSVATVSIRPGYVGGHKENVCYLGDLRIGMNRRIVLNWRKLYSEIIHHAPDLRELGNSRSFITSIIDDNKLARAALVQSKKAEFEYRHLSSYKMVNLLARLKSGKPAGGIEIKLASLQDLPKVFQFLDKKHIHRAFGYDESEWKRRLCVWPGLSAESFVLALDGSEIKGVFALWSPASAKQIMVDRLPAVLRSAFTAFRPVLPKLPRVGQALSITYLTHLHLEDKLQEKERALIFRQMLDFVYDEKLARQAQFLSYCDFNSHSLLPALSGIISHKTPISLYQVVGKKWANCPELQTLGDRPPAFEMSLV